MAIGGAIIGLIANLSPWRKGVKDAGKIVEQSLNDKNLQPFNRGIDDSQKKLSGLGGGLGGLKGAFGALTAVVGALGIARIFSEAKSVMAESLRAANDYEDSITKVQIALDTLPAAVKRGFDIGQLKTTGETLRRALGINETKSNGVFADFLTRGFDPQQSRRMLMLAANAAIATGQPIEDVANKISDAFNGNLRGLRELGIQIPATGDKVKDAEAAGLAVMAKFGKAGTALVDPIDLLHGNLDQLYVVLGERIAPILDPLIQKTSDFVGGLMESEKGREIIDGLAGGLESGIKWIAWGIPKAEGLFNAIFGGAKLSFNTIQLGLANIAGGIEYVWNKCAGTAEMLNGLTLKLLGKISGAISEFLESTKAGKFLSNMLGIDTTGWSKTYADLVKVGEETAQRGAATFDKEENPWITAFRDTAKDGLKDGLAQMDKGLVQITGDRGSDIVPLAEGIAEAGAKARERDAEKANADLAAMNGQSFAGSVARYEERQKAEERRKKSAEKSIGDHERILEKQRASVMARTPVGSGVMVGIVAARGSDKSMMRPARR